MGFSIKNFFVKEVPGEEDYPMPETEEVSTETESVEAVNLDSFGHETLIQDIYASAEIKNENGIFKVESISNSLPKETPKATKKATTLSIMNSFGISVESVIEDAKARLEALASTLAGIEEDCNNFVTESENQIEDYKNKIAELEKAISDKKADTKNAHNEITVEEERVAGLMNFIGGEDE